MTGPVPSGRSLSVSVLEVAFRVDFGPGVLEEDAARIAASWASCTTDEQPGAREILADVSGPTTSAAREGTRVLTHSIAQLEESLTSTLTIEAIGERRSDLLMLHACGIAADDGRVLAFVAASGTGKTTIARALGTRFGYVTDETVAVLPGGRVLPYPKPLSVKPLTGSAPKAQLSPGSLGLRPVPEAPLVLAGVVLLDRRDGVLAPWLEDVDPVEAIDDLVPQTSYLSARRRPLADLVRTLTGLGGVKRLVYSEADGAVGLVEDLFSALGGPAPPVWDEIVALPLDSAAEGGDGTVVQARADDALLLPDGGIIVFRDNRLVRLSGIGPAIWRSAGDGIRRDDLVGAVLDEIGGPPPGIDPAAAVTAAVDELEALGVIARAAPSGPTPEGVHA